MAPTDPLPILSAERAQAFAQRAREARDVPVDEKLLEADLRARISGEVRFDTSSRALYATDGSSYRQIPIGVVIPRNNEDVLATIATCREHAAPVLSRGGGTSLAGQCCNAAVVIDFSKYLAEILEIDPARKLARVQPGVILDHLRNTAEKHHLTFGPDPATHDRCTLGGMIGNNSCGTHSLMRARLTTTSSRSISSPTTASHDGRGDHTRRTRADHWRRRRARDLRLKSIADTYGDLAQPTRHSAPGFRIQP
jgi:hypothetical protein